MSPFFLLQIGELAATAGFLAPLPPFFTTDNNPVSPSTTVTGMFGGGPSESLRRHRHGDTHVRLLSELDRKEAEPETNDQTFNVDEETLAATMAPIDGFTAFDAVARMNARVAEQKRIAAELKARMLEDDDETFFMLT